jgi:hypothetical protein
MNGDYDTRECLRDFNWKQQLNWFLMLLDKEHEQRWKRVIISS